MMKKYLSLFMVLALIFVLSACGGKDKNKNNNQNTIANALAAENGTEVTVTGIIVGYGDGNYLSSGVYYIYNPEEDKAIYLYTANDQSNLPNIGDKIKATGIRDSFNGLPQIKNYTVEKIQTGIDVKQYYKELTVSQIFAKKDDYMLKPVLIKNAVVSSTPNNNDKTFFTDATGTLAVYRFGYIANSGVEYGDVVNLYACVTAYDYKGSSEQVQLHSAFSVSFPTLVKVENLTDQQKVDYAKLALYYPKSEITENINLPTTLPTGVTISWQSNNEAVIDTEGKVTRGEEDKTVKLTATITSGSVTATKEFTFNVPAEGVLTIAEARTKDKDTNVEIEGFVTRLIGSSAFIQDETAGIYVYKPKDSTALVVGNKVNVKGKIDIYSKAIQIGSGATVTKVSENHTVTATSYNTVADLQKANPQGMFVELKNLEVTNVPNAADKSSYSVTVKDSAGTTLVLRVDKELNPYIPASFFKVGDKYTSVKGGLSRYNDDLQLMLASTSDIVKANQTPEEILASAKERLNIANKDNITGDITLPTSDGDVEISWVSGNTNVITNDGKVTRPAVGEDDVQVELTATLTLGDLTETKKITVTVKAQQEQQQSNYAGLIFSQYIEGSGNNKVLEIYNGTGRDIDLSTFSVVLFTNGANQSGDGYANVLNLSGTLKNNQVIIIAHKEAKLPSGITANYSGDSYFYGWNGDDALVLFKDYDETTRQGTVIDSIGKVGEDPGTSWSNNGVSTADQTLIRKPTVTSGDTNLTDNFDPSVEWISKPKDSFEDLGTHTMNK